MTVQATRSVVVVGAGGGVDARARAWQAVGLGMGLAEDRRAVICDPENEAAGNPHWRHVIERGDVDIVDLCSSGDSHLEIVIAALEAGKHVICGRPMAASLPEAELMTRAATAAAGRGIWSTITLGHRRAAALVDARRRVGAGELGRVLLVRAQASLDPTSRTSGDARPPGDGADDVGALVLDAAEFVTGVRIDGVSALRHSSTQAPSALRPGPESDDAALIHARMTDGGLASLVASRLAPGRRPGLRLDVDGELGMLTVELDLVDDAAQRAAHLEAEFAEFLYAIADGRAPEPSFADGLHLHRVLDATRRSSENGSAWTSVDRDPTRRGARTRAGGTAS